VISNEPGASPAEGRYELGSNTARARQGGTSPAEARQTDGVSLQEAALRLDVSERTVRRLIREGEVQAYKQKATRGFVWRVVLPSQPEEEPSILDRQNGAQAGTSPAEGRQPGTSPAEAEEPATMAVAAPELMKALEIIEDIRSENRAELEQLRQENKELTAAASHWQARAQEQERRATHAEEQIKLLMAPKDEPITDEPQPRRWWQRIFS